MKTGTLHGGLIQSLVDNGQVTSQSGITDDQVQPSSLDLTLSSEAYRMPGSVLPLPKESVRNLIDQLALEPVNLSNQTCLARGNVYWVRLRESLALPPELEVYTNSKSSTGRIDLATRVLTDGNQRYDRISAGYQGELWIELIPHSFDVIIQSGLSLNQAIFFHDRQLLSTAELRSEHEHAPLLLEESGEITDVSAAIRDDRVIMQANLHSAIVGFQARRSLRPINLTKIGTHSPSDYFEPIRRPSSGYLFLEKDRFYIMATQQRVVIPAHLACEMVPYDPGAGEFRAHYAGFFDPGFGILDGKHHGTCAVLEVRPHEDDLILRDGQPICAMAYERLSENSPMLYGGNNNNYARQVGPKLSKHFISEL